jgi:Tfp pilus assembly protein PilF
VAVLLGRVGQASLRARAHHLCLPFLGLVLLATTASGQQTLTDADKLRLTGRYEEAAKAYDDLLEQEPVTATLGLARCREAVGRYPESERVLSAAIEKYPKAAVLPAELARLAFERGDHATAQRHAEAALALDKNQLLARLVTADLHAAAGRLKEAAAAYEWCVDHYNARDKFTDPDELRIIGLAAAQAARWKRRSGEFRFLVNELYPDALKLNKDYWPARLESAWLFLEKYNEPQAAAELSAALAINPNAAEIHVARAALALQKHDLEVAKTSLARALEINPNLLAAKRLEGDVLLADLRASEAIKSFEAARKLNPVDEETLGKLAAAYAAVEGLREDPAGTRMGELIEEAVKRNAHCGTFFASLAAGFDLLRRYPAAAKYYEEAYRRMPELAYVRGELGLVLMRLGEEAKAGPLLAESFKIDPFNVRVKNMLAVLDVLKGYAIVETEHFILRFDRGQDELLARYAARHLEDEVYPELVKELGYAPQGKSLFEIFSRAKNTSGHGWFSARMVGLPFVHTVGACAGKVVALASPGDLPQKYNWARVLKHEFVHVVNLQQTNFNVPHWFTEGLAVRHERLPRPPSWNEVLVKRSRAGTLFQLDNINSGFIRPTSGDDWTLAYCQAELYVEYMVEKYGEHALAKMLAAYADNLGTPEALKKSFGVEQAEVEAGYKAYVEKIVSGLSISTEPAPRTLEALTQAVEDKPDDPDAAAELAFAHLQRGANAEARRLALAAKKILPKQQLAAYVLARLQLSIGDAEGAEKLLEESLDPAAPQENALGLLAGLKLKAEDFAAAEKLYRVGAANWPHADKWLKALAKLHLQTRDNEKLAAVLATLAERDEDDFTLRKKLAQLASEKKDHPGAGRWAREAMQIDVNDAEVHAWLAQSLAAQAKHAAAIEEFETAIRLDGTRNDWRFALAEAFLDGKQPAKAKEALEALLKLDANYPGADVLLESIKE